MFIVLQGLHSFNKSNGENPLQFAGKALKDSGTSWLDEHNLLKSSWAQTSALLGVFNLWILMVPKKLRLLFCRFSLNPLNDATHCQGFHDSLCFKQTAYLPEVSCLYHMLLWNVALVLLPCTMSSPCRYLPFGAGGPCSTFQGDVHCQLFQHPFGSKKTPSQWRDVVAPCCGRG